MKTHLHALRESLRPKIGQEKLARKSDMSLQTYRNAEKGVNVSYTTATAILAVLNELLVENGRDRVQLEDLGLTIV